ncbi:MAG: hypothetical protein F3744_10825 [Nitrospinae bacterium]|nr:hypothetical protein [Nitrospinota bacterium]
MTLDITELNLQGGPREQRSSAAAVSASVSSELNIRTQEGDLVNLSFSSEQSLQESRTQTQSQESGSYQEISTVARAASSYSISVQGDLNEEELAAINKLAREISPIAKEFFANGGFDFESSGDVLAANLGVIQEVELSLERTIVAAFATRTGTQLPEEGFSPEDVEAALSNSSDALETEGIRDFPALVQATFDAVFEAEAASIPETDPILRSLNDLMDFIRQRLGEYFGPDNVELPPEAPVPGDGSAGTVEPSNPEVV